MGYLSAIECDSLSSVMHFCNVILVIFSVFGFPCIMSLSYIQSCMLCCTQSFKLVAQTLGECLVSRPDVRMDVLSALRKVIAHSEAGLYFCVFFCYVKLIKRCAFVLKSAGWYDIWCSFILSAVC